MAEQQIQGEIDGTIDRDGTEISRENEDGNHKIYLNQGSSYCKGCGHKSKRCRCGKTVYHDQHDNYFF